MIKRIISTLIITILALSVGITVNADVDDGFKDMPKTHWAYESVKQLEKEGIISGYADGNFKPNKTVTYGEFIKMAVIAVTGEDPGLFEGNGHWSIGYYNAALDENFLTDEEIYSSMLPYEITREKMAYIIANSIGSTLDKETRETIRKYIPDLDNSRDMQEEIITAYGAGIIGGYDNGFFRPEGLLTRAESAVIIARLAENELRLNIDFDALLEISTNMMPPLTKDTVLEDYILMIPDKLKRPIQEVAPNLNEYAGKTVKYYIIAEKNPYDFYVTPNYDGKEGIETDSDVVKYTNLALIKDKQIAYSLSSFDHDGSEVYYAIYNYNHDSLNNNDYDKREFPDFDYFGFYRTMYEQFDTMILLPNNLNEKTTTELRYNTIISDYIWQIPDTRKRPVNEVISNIDSINKESIENYVIDKPYSMSIAYITFGPYNGFARQPVITINTEISNNISLSLVKDGKVIYNLIAHDTGTGIRQYSVPNYSIRDIPDYDYIAMYPTIDNGSNTIVLIPEKLKVD